MRLWIAEKPSVAKAICNELGILRKAAGYTECKGGNTVTWCFGHLLEQAEPDVYTAADIPVNKKGKKVWRMQDLPIFPARWKLLPKSDKGVRTQLKVIKELLGKADCVVNCGDPDREGQLLVDEILEYYGNRKPVSRFWVSAQDPASIRKGLNSLKPNTQFQGMKLAALGRSRADWLIGMNLTRALTLAHTKRNEYRLIAVGRVQTPTLSLVAQRDRAVKTFKPTAFYVFKAHVKGAGKTFFSYWKPKETQKGLDEENRLISETQAENLAQELKSAESATVLKSESIAKKQGAPKAYSLADIQLEASNRFGFSAQETLDVCQSLYETHKITSYPRSDCEYLPESQFADAPIVLSAVASTMPLLSTLVRKANPNLKSAVWNDKKISAHHGIIPTQQSVDINALSDKEKKIYELIARRYIAQFFDPYAFNALRIDLEIKKELFVAKGKKVLQLGWKAVYQSMPTEEKDADADSDQILPELQTGDVLSVQGIECKKDQTKPPAYFTEGTLIAAMERIYTVVDNPEHKKLLKEGDGIGTPATRAAIISELKRKKYLVVSGKKIHATDEGVDLLSVVPPLVKNPVLTAFFERKLKEVEEGREKLENFIEGQKNFIVQEIEKARKIFEKAC